MSQSVQNVSVETQDDLIAAIFIWLHGLSNVIDDQSREIERLTGLNKNQALAIKMLSRSPKLSVSSLARSMYLYPATMVRILDRLEERGLICRIRSKDDRRVVEISLTDKAQVTEQIVLDVTRDSLTHCFGLTEENNLLDLYKMLEKFSLQLDVAYMNPSRIRDLESLKGK